LKNGGEKLIQRSVMCKQNDRSSGNTKHLGKKGGKVEVKRDPTNEERAQAEGSGNGKRERTKESIQARVRKNEQTPERNWALGIRQTKTIKRCQT